MIYLTCNGSVKTSSSQNSSHGESSDLGCSGVNTVDGNRHVGDVHADVSSSKGLIDTCVPELSFGLCLVHPCIDTSTALLFEKSFSAFFSTWSHCLGGSLTNKNWVVNVVHDLLSNVHKTGLGLSGLSHLLFHFKVWHFLSILVELVFLNSLAFDRYGGVAWWSRGKFCSSTSCHWSWIGGTSLSLNRCKKSHDSDSWFILHFSIWYKLIIIKNNSFENTKIN